MLKQHIDFLQKLLEKLGGDDDGHGGPGASSAGSAEAPKPTWVEAAEESHEQKMERLFSTVSCLGLLCCLHMSCVN